MGRGRYQGNEGQPSQQVNTNCFTWPYKESGEMDTRRQMEVVIADNNLQFEKYSALSGLNHVVC